MTKGLKVLTFFLVIYVVPATAQDLIEVPGSVANLQDAINMVSDGGVIRLANGNYPSPAGGFLINNEGKAFTIRAATSGLAILDGGGTREVLRIINGSVNLGGPVTFEGITFANGFSNTEGNAAGVTIQKGEATFFECRFENNASITAISGGGGTLISEAKAFFVDSIWDGNSSRTDGGGMFVFGSDAIVHNSQFLNNRTNVPMHRNTSSGGGLGVATDVGAPDESRLRVSNTRFEGNQAGYVGGGIYGLGRFLDPVSTPRTVLLVANSTFENNIAMPDPGVTLVVPTEGGGFHTEDQTTAMIFNSRFIKNRSENGGGVNLYRAITEVHDSVFLGNQATGLTVNSRGFGGAMSAISDDTPADGSSNRRAASLTVRDSLIQGRFDTVTTVAQIGGGIFGSGDLSRFLGTGGVGQMGSAAANRANIVLSGTAINDCDATQTGGLGTGIGGGLQVGLSSLTMDRALIMASDGLGADSQGGGLRMILETDATITNTTLAKNSAVGFGAGVFMQGSDVDFSSCNFIENDYSPGTSETVSISFGAAMFSGPDVGAFGPVVPMTGTVANSTFGNNVGLPIFDDDRSGGPINDLRYDGNNFGPTTFGTDVYRDSIVGPTQSATTLNTLVVARTVADTDKSQVNNTASMSDPIVGSILAVPPKIIPVAAAGDAMSTTQSYLAYAWSGGSATLDGNSVIGNTGQTASTAGNHTLLVSGSPFNATITQVSAPDATFTANPPSVDVGGSVTLNWATTSGTYLDMDINQGVVVNTPAASGMVNVTVNATTTFHLFILTEEGGILKSLTVPITSDVIFKNGFE